MELKIKNTFNCLDFVIVYNFLFSMPVPHWAAVLISRNHSITRLISFQKNPQIISFLAMGSVQSAAYAYPVCNARTLKCSSYEKKDRRRVLLLTKQAASGALYTGGPGEGGGRCYRRTLGMRGGGGR
jgi:hypothetical protein